MALNVDIKQNNTEDHREGTEDLRGNAAGFAL